MDLVKFPGIKLSQKSPPNGSQKVASKSTDDNNSKLEVKTSAKVHIFLIQYKLSAKT